MTEIGAAGTWAAIAVALIAGISSIVAAVISSRTRRENKDQHGGTAEGLARVEGAVIGLTGQVGEMREVVQRTAERTAVLEAYMGDRVTGGPDRHIVITKEIHHE